MRPRVHGVAIAAGCLLVATVGVSASQAGSAAPSRETQAQAARRTLIAIDAGVRKGSVSPGLLGVNQRFNRNGSGVWQVAEDRPVPRVVRHLRRAGVDNIRFPGGIVGNLFRWQRSIGPHRPCQVNGRLQPDGYDAIRNRLRYGIDEHMRLVEAIGGRVIIMQQTITSTPRDAADFVEYVNSPAGTDENPNGGVDWAEVRAENGHPAPYRVRMWELGNEHRLPKQRYWMSSKTDRAVRQYAFGASPLVEDEALGRGCRHPFAGVPSNGRRGQAFQLLYPPAKPGSVRVRVGSRTWTEVDDLTAVQGPERVFTVDEQSGVVIFGDGSNGAIPRAGSRVVASYRSVHKGVFSFIRKMKEVDPSIKVCPAWDTAGFLEVAGRREFDCLAAHRYLFLRQPGVENWDSALEGHEHHMVRLVSERNAVAALKRRLPTGVSMPLTEFGSIKGDNGAFPSWGNSMSSSTFMASEWLMWLKLGLTWGNGNDLLGGHNALVGRRPQFKYTAELATRQILSRMFEARGSRVKVTLERNPVRISRLADGRYRAFEVGATRGRDGRLYLAVVNRLPFERHAVSANIRINGFRNASRAYVQRVEGRSFKDWNEPTLPESVRVESWRRSIARGGFSATFPAHSITVFAIPRRG